eukprot:TRINITY_DN51059_c0_g1_i1.p1 TRINITY_DN51059_c0_g1~~TRINITY_DN51059_c0_g1_i1.p1  ORF type:complete len:494 (+),score=77.96 TRINITY_DN51059_c0_g1_i1:82-1482(+)
MEDKLEDKLQLLARDRLVPPRLVCERVKADLHKLTQCLTKLRHFKVSRVRVAGSYAKTTACYPQFDVDIIVLINGLDVNKDAEYEKSKADIAEAVRKHTDATDVHNGPRSVQFKLRGLDFDVLPAPCYGSTPQEHYSTLLKEAVQDEEEARSRLAPAFAERVCQFISGQDEYTKDLIRLAKFWSHTSCGLKFPGMSFAIELIAVDAARKETHQYTLHRTLSRGLQRFWRNLVNLDQLQVTWSEGYDGTDIPSSIHGQRPLVMDPANPINNVGFTTKDGLQALMSPARAAAQASDLSGMFRTSIDPSTLTKLIRSDLWSSVAGKCDNAWLADARSGPSSPQVMTVAQRHGHADLELITDVLRHQMLINAHILGITGESDARAVSKSVAEAFRKGIADAVGDKDPRIVNCVGGHKPVNGVSSDGKHDDYACTIHCPIPGSTSIAVLSWCRIPGPQRPQAVRPQTSVAP